MLRVLPVLAVPAGVVGRLSLTHAICDAASAPGLLWPLRVAILVWVPPRQCLVLHNVLLRYQLSRC